MTKKNNDKKIEKLRQKIEEIDKRIKIEVSQKQDLMKEIETLEAESILSACKNSNISYSEAVESFDLFSKLKEDGISYNDIKDLIAARSINNSTLSPVDTKSEEDANNV